MPLHGQADRNEDSFEKRTKDELIRVFDRGDHPIDSRSVARSLTQEPNRAVTAAEAGVASSTRAFFFFLSF